jgi:hypothetical protein
MDESNIPELPSDELIWRVTSTRSRERFWNTGSRSVNEINAVLSVIGSSLIETQMYILFLNQAHRKIQPLFHL